MRSSAAAKSNIVLAPPYCEIVPTSRQSPVQADFRPGTQLKAYILHHDTDSALQLKKLIEASGRAVVAGLSLDPVKARFDLRSMPVDALFVGCGLAETSGFTFLQKLPSAPPTVFMSSDRWHAEEAFEAGAVDYLRTPFTASRLSLSLDRLERVRQDNVWRTRPDILHKLAEMLQEKQTAPERLASRTGQKIELIDLQEVTHFYAQDKLTYAATSSKHHPVDETMTQLEARMDPRKFVRVHRAAIVRIDCVREVLPWFAGRLLLRLSDEARTELAVSRDRIRLVRERLGI